METIRGTVEHVIFKNKESGWTVVGCEAKGYRDPVTAVGIMPKAFAGSVLSMDGQWVDNLQYGRQFKVIRYEEKAPATVYGIEKYLGSGLIHGVGPKTASKIVKAFGKDTLDILDSDPDRLYEVEGLGVKSIEKIKEGWLEPNDIRNIMVFLQSHDISTKRAAKIYEQYDSESLRVVKENPYRLADDIEGIGFKTADHIAMKLGFEKTRFIRLRSGISYTLNKLAEKGHCYAEREQLARAAECLLEVDRPRIEMTLDEMIRTADVIQEGDAIYLRPAYYAETGCARRLLRILDAGGMKISAGKALGHIRSVVPYDGDQLAAIRKAMESKVMVLTGGPGTGKTTTTLGIISAYKSAGRRILLAAPTGRAAKRMSEATGMEAATIHRLLEYDPKKKKFRHDENRPLQADVLIVDECSMIDIFLMYSLLKAVPGYMHLVLVGDADQLPSVGAGNVFRDIIASGAVPVARLGKIFRQAQGSRIITNAHRINEGKMPEICNQASSDYFFASRKDGDTAAKEIVRLCAEGLAQFCQDPLQDIQVLAPMKKGICGTGNLNRLLQEAMNPGSAGVTFGDVQFRENDKVMQIRNNYDKGVFNGNIGRVVSADKEKRTVTVDFEGEDVTYDDKDMDELMLAYATTIHKAQGSEYPIVVMPVLKSHFPMLQRNLLYTGVTRAKKMLVMIGDKEAVGQAIKRNEAEQRNTKLAQRLREPDALPVKKARREAAACEGEPVKIREALDRLAQSDAHSCHVLNANEFACLKEKGKGRIRSEAADSVRKRLAPAKTIRDGKQTPKKGSPVYIAQHATATSSRQELEEWHGIPKGRELTEGEQAYIVDIIMAWIARQAETFGRQGE